MTIEELLARTVEDGECARWTGAHIPTGYGQIRRNGKAKSVHRVAYELAVGPIAPGLEIDHLCFVRDCINVEHLEAVTHRENLLRSARAGRNALKLLGSTCSNGHPVTPESRVYSDGRDVGCRICRRLWNADYRKLKTACEECGKIISVKNLKNHMSNIHNRRGNNA